MKAFFFYLWTFFVSLHGIQSEVTEDNPTVTLTQGQLKGKYLNSTHGIKFSAFLGIPYGKVDRRFTPPEPADSWNGILDATKDGPACKQFDFFLTHAIQGQEDGCLVLNVYTPKLSTEDSTSPLPVMVFIHGGGFMMGVGLSTLFGPQLYMNKEIVLVVMNYRLGPIGFLSTGDEESPGNYGLLDQVLALKWVKDNIHSFGGDPNRVTISGISAGGAAVVFHLLSPLSAGLFHRAIAQSGSALCHWAIQENPLNISKRIAEKVDCPTENTTAMIECLREVDADLLVKAGDFSKANSSITFLTVPVVENSINGKFLTESPLKLLEEGRINRVPVISGVTSSESSYLITMVLEMLNSTSLLSTSNFTDNDWSKFIKIITGFGQESEKLNNAETLQDIKRRYYENMTFENNSNDFHSQTIKLSSDCSFKSCNDKTVELLAAAGVPVYMYIWDYAENLTNLSIDGRPAAYHGIDLFYLFYPNGFGAMWNYTLDSVHEFSDQVLDLWSNFAAEGNPTPSAEPVEWVPTTATNIKYLNMTKEMNMQDGYSADTFTFWDDIFYK